MSVYNVPSGRLKRWGLSALSIFCCIILAVQIALVSSPIALAASTNDQALGKTQALDFAGVSVVRLVSTYKPADQLTNATPASFAQCTGLGVIVSSWQSLNGNDNNNWIMTDGNLVNPVTPSCLQKTSNVPSLVLASVDIYFNTTFNSTIQSLQVPNSSVHCLTTCTAGLALVSFQSLATLTYPHVDRVSNDPIENTSILLGLADASASLPASSNTNPKLRDQYAPAAQRFLTMRMGPMNPNSELESGTPIFNEEGELTGIMLNDNLQLLYRVANVAAIINGLPNVPPPSQSLPVEVAPTPHAPTPVVASSAHTNAVYDNWKKGITSYYQGDYPTAHTAFQAAASGNALFTAPVAFEQLIALHSNGVGQSSSLSSIGIKFWFIDITIPDVKMLIVLGVVLLCALLIFVFALRIRRRAQRRRVLAEYTELERRAELEAQRIMAMEAVQVQHSTPRLQPSAPSTAFSPGKSVASALIPALACPNCGTSVKAEDKFCANCRTVLVATASGFHIHKANSPPLPVQPIRPETKPIVNPSSESTPERHCPRCNTTVRHGAIYCPNCRLKQGTSDAAGQQPAQPVQAPPSAVVPAPPTIPFTPVQPPTVEAPLTPVPSPVLPIPVQPELNKPDVVSDDPKVPAPPVEENVQPVVNIGATAYINQRLGDYRIKGLLGHGGFADVYLGEHVYLKTSVAIKVLHKRLTSGDLVNFLREARTVASLNHAHIVRILDFRVEGNEPDMEKSSFEVEGCIPFLIMEYASGGTLRERHPKGTRVPLSIIVPYVKQVADALQYAHDKKLIHRDVKPENMLLGQDGKVLLSDFGIVAVAHDEHSMSMQEMAGTVPYIAPEQISGRPHLASDQYSLAVVVYEWLTGKRPFQSDTAWGIIQQHLFIPPAHLQVHDLSLSPLVDAVVLKALAKDPTQRYESVSAFADALAEASK